MPAHHQVCRIPELNPAHLFSCQIQSHIWQTSTVGRYLRLAKPAISTIGLEGAGEAKPVIPTAGNGVGRKWLVLNRPPTFLRECAPIANGIDLSLLEARQPHQAG
jgi:hypothetical protein